MTIGRLGRCEFAVGFYYYVGSAFGPGGLRARIRHHLSPIKRPHWHMDYVHGILRVEEIWYCEGKEILEHEWTEALRVLVGTTFPVSGFGASDCRCKSHLIYSRRLLDLARCSIRHSVMLPQ